MIESRTHLTVMKKPLSHALPLRPRSFRSFSAFSSWICRKINRQVNSTWPAGPLYEVQLGWKAQLFMGATNHTVAMSIIYIYYISLDFNRFHDISITRDLDGFDVSLTCIFLGQLLNWKPQVVWSRLSISSWRFQPILKTWQSIGIIISSLGFDQKILKTTQLIRYSCNSV